MQENTLNLLFKCNLSQHSASTLVYCGMSTQIDFDNPEQASELFGFEAEQVWKQ